MSAALTYSGGFIPMIDLDVRKNGFVDGPKITNVDKISSAMIASTTIYWESGKNKS